MSKPLPPLPVPPKRALKPPTRGSGTFRLDDATPTRTIDTAQLATIVSLCERMNPKQRDRFAALGDLIEDLPLEQVERLIDIAVEMHGL